MRGELRSPFTLASIKQPTKQRFLSAKIFEKSNCNPRTGRGVAFGKDFCLIAGQICRMLSPYRRQLLLFKPIIRWLEK
jgi:hypothetical protein